MKLSIVRSSPMDMELSSHLECRNRSTALSLAARSF